jgi:VWFA-related protein
MRNALLCLLTFLFVATTLAQTPPQQHYEVTVTTIDVWVKVTDKSGKPIEGLKQEDFQILEDDQPVQSTCFEEVKVQSAQSQAATPGATAAAEAPAEIPAKKFVIFLDLFNTSQPEYLYIKSKILDFLKKFQGSGRQIMLAGILPNRNMGVFSPFTTDVNKISELIDKAQGNTMRDVNVDNHEADIRRILTGGGEGRAGVSENIREGYQTADSYSKLDSENTKFSLQALDKFGSYLAKQSQSEHMVVLYLSGGFSSDPGRRYFDIVDRAVEDMREQIQDADQVVFRQTSQFNFYRELEASIGRMNKLNITLYTINTRGLVATDPGYSKQHLTRTAVDTQALKEFGDSLMALASETGGTSFNNSQNFKLGFNNVLTDLNQQYLPCYSAPQHKQPGQYHKIKVTVKQPGVDIRARNGYID